MGGVNVAAVCEQGLAATSVQLHIRLPWLRQPPVLHWVNLAIALSAFSLHHLLNLGGAK